MRWIIYLLCLLFTTSGTAIAESGVRYAYTPVSLGKSSYAGLVSPAKHSFVNSKASKIIKEVHEDLKKQFRKPFVLEVGIRFMERRDFLTETQAPSWTNAMYSNKEIIIPIDDFTNLDWEKITASLKHEYLHALVDEVSMGNCPAWLDEGLAQINEGPESEILTKSLNSWLKNNETISLKDLEKGFTKLAVKKVGPAYAISRKATEKLIKEHGGYLAIFKFIRASRTGNITMAFQASFGITQENFEQELTF